METRALGPWELGIINKVPPESVFIGVAETRPKVGLVDAENVDILPGGVVATRDGWVRVDNTPARDLFEHAGRTFGIVGTVLGELTDSDFRPIAEPVSRASWTVVNDEPVFCTDEGVFRIVSGELHPFDTTTTPDEAQLLLRPMVGGSHIGLWQGRLLVARGTTLFWSEALRYGLYDPLRNHIKFEQRITWIVPLSTGIYVGLSDTVRFLGGRDPTQLAQRVVSGRSWVGSGAKLLRHHLGPDAPGDAAAVWFCSSGFALGLSDGKVVYPQAERIANLPHGSGKIAVSADRVTLIPN